MPVNRTLCCLALALAGSTPLQAQTTIPLDSATLASFRFRSIGPANMGGRITDVEAVAGNSKAFYVATATGGIWKTLNAGTTFFPLFQNERVISLGDIAIAPSNSNIIWAGTGEEDSRNSASPGGGVYKSVDAGVTWQLMGLEKTQHIGRIIIDPKDPNIVYVAAVGALWTSNPDRGLYMTVDGGKTWTLSKFISDKAGFIDIAMDPRNSKVLYASSWERVRKPYALESGGPGSALWKSTNGGKSWTEITGGGFPATTKGRISLAIAPSDSKIVYAQVEADSVRGAKPSRLLSGTYRSADAGKTWTWMNMDNYRPFYFSQIRVDPANPNRIYRLAQAFHFSDDGGASWRPGGLGLHEDTHAMWIDPEDPEHYIVGGDAGLFHSWDKGGTYDVQNLMPLAQFYAVSFDFAMPYRVCGGMQDNGTSCGPSRKRSGPILTTDWFALAAADGFYTAQDPSDPNIIYYETQGGNMSRRDLRTGETANIKPRTLSNATYGRQIAQILASTDSAATAAQQQRIVNVQKRMNEETSNPNVALRWNWNTPFLISAHDPNVFYSGAEKLFRSRQRGTDPVAISPDLTAKDPMHLRRSTGFDERGYPATDVTGGITNDVSWLAEVNTTIVTIAESPLRAGLLYVGTGDGKVWLTRNDGESWEDLTSRFPGVPPMTYVSRIEASNFDTSTVYVTFDGHHENDFTPYIFRSIDAGKSFQSIAGDIPVDGPAFVRVIREDPRNRNLLYAGTDVGLFFSLNGGTNWQQLKSNLPTVPVYDLKIHPRDRELIIASHGRGVWILDVNPLQQMADSILRKPAHLFAPAPAYQYVQPPAESELRGNRGWRGDSGPYGAELTFFLSKEITTPAVVLVSNVAGDTIARMTAMARPGINRVTWNFQQGTGIAAGGGRNAGAGGGAGGGGGGGGRGAGGGRGGAAAADTVFPGVPPGFNPRPAESSARPDSSRNPMVAARSDSVGRGGRAGGGGGGGVANDSTNAADSTAAAGRGAGRGAGGGGGGGGSAGGAGRGGAGGGAGRGGAGGGRTGGGGGGGGGAAGGAPVAAPRPTGLAPTGDYLITLIVDGQQYKQALRVEQIENWTSDVVVGAPARRR